MPEQQSILTKNRPDQVAWWLKRGRKPKILPVIEKPREFAIEWQKWWLAMQPDWRRIENKDKEWTTMARTAPDDTDNAWSDSKLLRSGPVGFRLIIMALAWWGQVVLKEKDTAKFLEAVEDVKWVLKLILNSFASNSKPMTKKRFADNDEPSGSNKK